MPDDVRRAPAPFPPSPLPPDGGRHMPHASLADYRLSMPTIATHAAPAPRRAASPPPRQTAREGPPLPQAGFSCGVISGIHGKWWSTIDYLLHLHPRCEHT